MSHKFNWHDENEKDSFLGWVVVNLLSDKRRKDDHDEFERLEKATDSWRDIELGITINGIEVDAEAFVHRVEESRNWAIQRGVAEKMRDIPELVELDNTISRFREAVEQKMHQIAAEHDIEIPEKW